ncbi:PAN/Apple domain [Trinorchestia longiramus]|nr:PAN/Apple domain [Trinorchestia longiramus]
MLLEVFLLYLLCSPVCAAHFTVHAYSALPATDLLESVVTSSKCECKLRCLVSIKCMGCTYDNSPSNKSANCQLVTSAHHNDLQTSRNATSFIRLGSADTRTTVGSDDTATSRTDPAEVSTLNNGNEETTIPKIGNEETTAPKISNEKETTAPIMGKEESTTTKISSKELTTLTIVPKEFPTSTIDRAEPTTYKIDEPTRSKVDEDQSTTSMMDNKDLTTLSSTVSTTTEGD